MSSTISTRYDFVYLFDATDANPNGDPDAGNMPRVDPETGHGLVTDVCLKRKIRNFVQMTRENQPPFCIYVKEKAVLTSVREAAYKALDKKSEPSKEAEGVRDWMCANFFDIRAFGAVMMAKEFNCGQVRGPIQLSFARSQDPVTPTEHSITRCAVETPRESEDQQGGNRTMGRKYTLPYGLYLAHGFVNPFLARQTGFSEADLSLLWESLIKAFDFDQSAARPAGSMAVRRLIVFKHKDALGNAPAHKLFERVSIKRVDESKPARVFADYTVVVNRSDLPPGIEIIEML